MKALTTDTKCHAWLPMRQSSDTLRSIGGGSVRAMEAKGRELSPARTNLDDYVGTVAADDAEAVLDLPSLDDLEKIDRDRYTMVGIDVKVDGPATAVATVYAIDRLDDSVLSIRLRDRPTLGSWAAAAVGFL
jgi:hypothetical protein